MSVKNPLGVWWAGFNYSNDANSWPEKAGSSLDIKAAFVKAPEGVRFESSPKVAQTYDPLFGPSMEKVVGITDHYHATVGDLEYDISGRDTLPQVVSNMEDPDCFVSGLFSGKSILCSMRNPIQNEIILKICRVYIIRSLKIVVVVVQILQL